MWWPVCCEFCDGLRFNASGLPVASTCCELLTFDVRGRPSTLNFHITDAFSVAKHTFGMSSFIEREKLKQNTCEAGRFWPGQFGPKPILANPCLDLVFAFFPLPPQFYFFLSGFSSLNSGGVFEGRDLQMCTFFSGCRVKPRRLPHPSGPHPSGSQLK